jgi:hypothetical protein
MGRASEPLCAQASSATRRLQRIVRVYLVAYQMRGKRCRFLSADGRLSRLRSCSSPIRMLARGTTSWVLHLRGTVAAGRYRIRSDAVDGFRHHQRPAAASVTTVTIR